jgi:chemotaxis-related protein WspB
MLYLLLQIGKDRYAIAARSVVEVAPLVDLKTLPQAPPGVAGLMDYRGSPVPVVDIAETTMGERSPRRLGTRILLVNCSGSGDSTRLLGLLAPHVTEMIRLEPQAFVDTGVQMPGTPYLGPVAKDERGLIQLVDVSRLLPPAIRDILFTHSHATT